VTFAGVVQLAILLWLLRRNGFTLRLRLLPLEPGTRQILKMLLPALVGVGMLQISSLFDIVALWALTATKDSPHLQFLGLSFAKPMIAGVLVRWTAATRLYQFPLGVLATSLGVAVFPLLTRYAVRNDMPNFRDSLNRALRLSMMEALATATGLFMLATPIIQLIYQHGEFHQADTEQAAFLLKTYLLGIWAMATYQIFVRAFNSFKDMTTAPKVLGMGVLLYVALVVTLVWVPVRWLPSGLVPIDPRIGPDQRLGAGALGIATVITWSINTVVLAWKLRKRLGVFGGRKLACSVCRTLMCCGIMAEVLMILQWQLKHRLANSLLVAICVAVGGATFFLAARVLRAPEIGELLGSMKKKAKDSAAARESGKTG
jgi:putative peptidoglycan lipid II flippase